MSQGFLIKTGLIIVILSVQMMGFALPVRGEATGSTWEFSAGYQYFHIRDDFPFKDQLDSQSRMVDLLFGYSTGDAASQFCFSFESAGNPDDIRTDLRELAWSGKAAQLVYEFGKTKWVWGRGLSYIPTCPLDKDRFYWGLQGSYINLANSVSLGVAFDQDSYYSKFLDNSPTPKNDPDDNYTGWFRFSRVFETSDLTAVLSYQSEQEYWNYGVDFSQDLLNGFEMHGGINLRTPDSGVRYLAGGQYSGKYLYIVELYHETSDNFILAVSNAAEMFGSWQWEIREVYNLNDSGTIHRLNFKYIKNNRIVPELDVWVNGGPNRSDFQQNPFDYGALVKVTSKF